jgi:Fe-S oxidoreductase
LRASSEDFVEWTANERLEEAKTTHAETLVTCCPFAKTNLKGAATKNGSEIKVLDLVEVVAHALE